MFHGVVAPDGDRSVESSGVAGLEASILKVTPFQRSSKALGARNFFQPGHGDGFTPMGACGQRNPTSDTANSTPTRAMLHAASASCHFLHVIWPLPEDLSTTATQRQHSRLAAKASCKLFLNWLSHLQEPMD